MLFDLSGQGAGREALREGHSEQSVRSPNRAQDRAAARRIEQTHEIGVRGSDHQRPVRAEDPCRACEDARVVRELLEAVQDPHAVELANLEALWIERLAVDLKAPCLAMGDDVGIDVDARHATACVGGELQEGSAVAADLEQPSACDHTPRPDAGGAAIELGPPLATQLIERVPPIATPRVPGHVIAASCQRIPKCAPAGRTPVDGSRVVVDEAVETSASSPEVAADRLGRAQQRRGRRATHDAAATGKIVPMAAHAALLPSLCSWQPSGDRADGASEAACPQALRKADARTRTEDPFITR